MMQPLTVEPLYFYIKVDDCANLLCRYCSSVEPYQQAEGDGCGGWQSVPLPPALSPTDDDYD